MGVYIDILKVAVVSYEIFPLFTASSKVGTFCMVRLCMSAARYTEVVAYDIFKKPKVVSCATMLNRQACKVLATRPNSSAGLSPVWG